MVTARELSARIGADVGHWVRIGVIPPPTGTVRAGNGLQAAAWTDADADAAVDAFRRRRAEREERRRRRRADPAGTPNAQRRAAGYASVADVAQAAGLSPTAALFHLRTGAIPPPSAPWPGTPPHTRYYTPEQAAAVVAFLGRIRATLDARAARRHEAGRWGRGDVAQAAGISRQALAAAIRAGTVPPPSHGPHGKYYDPQTAGRIVERLRRR